MFQVTWKTCQSLKLSSHLPPGTPSSLIGRHNLSLTQGMLSFLTALGWPLRLELGECQEPDFPSGILCDLITVSILRAQRSEAKTHLYRNISSKFQSYSFESLRDSFPLTPLNPGWVVGAKTCEKLVSSSTFSRCHQKLWQEGSAKAEF